jgi:serine/threonine protein kinase
MNIDYSSSTSDKLQPGFRLGGYIIDIILGQGGFGVTYKAKEVNSGKLVVIKEHYSQAFFTRLKDCYTVAPKESVSQGVIDTGIDAFLREAKTLAAFSHPNIVQIIDYFEAMGTAYIVMPFWEGRTLAKMIEDDPTALCLWSEN